MSTLTRRSAHQTGSAVSERDRLAERLLRAGWGDEAAFAELYDEVSHRVYGITLRVLRDPHQAEEASQEAFAEIWSKAGRFDPARGTALSWMLTLAHRRAVDQVRSSTAARRRDDTWSRLSGEDPRPDATFDGVHTNLVARSVDTALACLPAAQRRAVELAYFEGHTYPDVARLMEAPLGTTKTRMRTALRRLRDQFDGAGSAPV